MLTNNKKSKNTSISYIVLVSNNVKGEAHLKTTVNKY